MLLLECLAFAFVSSAVSRARLYSVCTKLGCQIHTLHSVVGLKCGFVFTGGASLRSGLTADRVGRRPEAELQQGDRAHQVVRLVGDVGPGRLVGYLV